MDHHTTITHDGVHHHTWSRVDHHLEECTGCGALNPGTPHPAEVPDCRCGRGLALYIWDDSHSRHVVCSPCFTELLDEARAAKAGAA